MQLSDPQREAILGNCLSASWQQLLPWRLRQQGAPSDTPAVLIDHLLQADARAQMAVPSMMACLESRLWWVKAGSLQADQFGARSLQVVCGSQRWTVWQQLSPMHRVLRITR